MSRGIYIVANDRVKEHAIALLNSIRAYDADTPVVMIPYNEEYQEVAKILTQSHGVQIYEDLELVERLSQQIHQIFGTQFFANPSKHRKHACWFGPFDEFLYIDTDIVVFDQIVNNLNYLSEYDFICYDYQHRTGIKNVFTSKVIEDSIFSEAELKDVFNTGFWASKKTLISESDLYETFAECAAHPEYFDFSQKISDQPIINYTILKRIHRRFNIIRRPNQAPGNWAGTTYFQPQGNVLFDPTVNQSLQFLHWAGIRIEPGCPYWEIWEHYRNLDKSLPPAVFQSQPRRSPWRRTVDKIKTQFRTIKGKSYI